VRSPISRRRGDALAAPLDVPDPNAHLDYAQPYVRFRQSFLAARPDLLAMADATPERAARADRHRPTAARVAGDGLVIVVTLLTIALIALAGSHLDRRTGWR
jgi:hypothetical protein